MAQVDSERYLIYNIHMINKEKNLLRCFCDDCMERDEPCYLDCDRDCECHGCYEARIAQEEVEFETQCALGVR